MMNKELIKGIAWGGGAIVLALGMSYARKLGYVDGDVVTRVVIGYNGLMIAWYGNDLPKAFVPHAGARKARRIAGWSMFLSGLVYAGLFAFAPLPLAAWGGAAAVVTGIAVTISYCLSLRAKVKTAT